MSKSGESVEYIVQEQCDDSLVWFSRFYFVGCQDTLR